MNWNYPNRLWHRRDLLKAIAATAIAAPAILRGETARTAHRIIKIGYVSPLTGPLAGFGEADRFILGQVRSALAQGLVNGDLTYQVEIINKDSQSNASRASEVALKRARNLDDSGSLLEAMKATDYNSVVGPLKWTGEPVKERYQDTAGRRSMAQDG